MTANISEHLIAIKSKIIQESLKIDILNLKSLEKLVTEFIFLKVERKFNFNIFFFLKIEPAS
jgi:hypothetical protein